MAKKTKRQKNDWQKNALFFCHSFFCQIFLTKKQGFHLLGTNILISSLALKI